MHAKVQVDLVKAKWVGFTLIHPPFDEVLTLEAARVTFIQLLNHIIQINITPKPAPSTRQPPRPPPTHVSAPPTIEDGDEDLQLQYDIDFWDKGLEVDSTSHMTHFPPPAKKSKKAQSSPPKHETKKKAVGMGRGGKVQASLTSSSWEAKSW